MFCAQCGSQVPAGGAFCVACGARAGAAAAAPAPAAPATAPAPAAAPLPPGVVTVEAQGLDASMRASGSYDSTPLGALTALQLAELLGRLAQGPSMPPAPPDADVCAVNVIVHGPGGTITFAPGDGRIVTGEGAGPMTPDDAARYAFGAAPSVAPRRTPKGGGPVRHAQIPPTDMDRVEPNVIQTGPASPQVAVPVRRTGLWGSRSAVVFFVLALPTGLVTVGGATQSMPAVAAIGGLAFLACIALGIASVAGRNETLRIGIDWTWNVLWFVRPGEKVRYVPNANALRGLIKQSGTVRRTTGRVGGIPVKGNVRVWQVAVVRADGTEYPTFHLPVETEGDADRVVAAGNQLLAMS